MAFAVVGMDAVLPGAIGAEAWIARSRAGEPAFSDVPEGRWPMASADVLDPRVGAPDATPTRRGAFVDGFAWDGAGLGLDAAVAAMDPLFQWVLHVTRGAASRADLPLERTDLLLANLMLPSSGAVRAVAGPFREALAAAGLDNAWLDGGHPDDAAHAELPALLAARALGLGGHVTALDAACASGLYAVRLACDRLAAGRCDAAIAAAVNRADSAFLHLGFAQLRALSRSGASRPLDRRGDGLLVGEGAVAVVLKRLEDAVRDGDRIHAVIRGGGLGNDGRKGNLLAPNTAGQLRTLRSAWEGAGLDPRTVGYVECHATGTPVGDKSEIEALRTLLEGGLDRPVALSSAKALIGHTVTAAGLAGLVRAVGAVRDGFLPPIPCDEPLDGLGDGVLRVVTAPEAWDADLRRAAVSAFGFGGTNAHLIVDRYPAEGGRPASAMRSEPRSGQRAASGQGDLPLAIVGLASRPGDDDVVLDATRFRVPPLELAEMLPQQVAFLETAADALAGLDLDPARIGCVAGMALDAAIAEPVIRWAAGEAARRAGRDPQPVMDAIAPALTASRVQGVLPNFVANRLSALLDLQGPSYAVAAGAGSLPVALAHAERLLASGSVDAVVAGAVDLQRDGGRGAVALVVRRLDAVRPGERVHAVLRDVRGTGRAGRAADDGFALLDAVLAVRDRVRDARAWLVDADEGPRRLTVAGIVVEEPPVPCPEPRGTRPAVLALRAEDAGSLLAAVRAALARLDAVPAEIVPADAHRWLARETSPGVGRLGVGLVASSVGELRARLTDAIAALEAGERRRSDPRGLYLREEVGGEVAFVFPGAGSAHPGMGREVGLAFPQAVRRQEQRTRKLRSQTCDSLVHPPFGTDIRLAQEALLADPVGMIWSSAWHSLLLADVLRNELGLRADASLGYSLGESSGLCALGAWTELDVLHERITTWPLFTTALAGPMTAIAEAWTRDGVAFDDPPFHTWVVKAPREAVAAACAAEPGVSVLMVNTPDECVIGGPREGVARVLDAVGGERFASPFHAAVHAPEVAVVRDEYVALHTVATTPTGVRFYSAATGAPYEVTSASAAEAIAAQAVTTVDWPRLVDRAWADGVRVFVEVGPRGACTRWTSRILGDREHVAVQTDRPGRDGLSQLAHAVAELLAAGVQVDHRALVGEPRTRRVIANPIRVPVRRKVPVVPGGAVFGGELLPKPLPWRGEPIPGAKMAGDADPAMVPLDWARWVGAPVARDPRAPMRPAKPIAVAVAGAAVPGGAGDRGDREGSRRIREGAPSPGAQPAGAPGRRAIGEPNGRGSGEPFTFGPVAAAVGSARPAVSPTLLQQVAGIASLAESVSRSTQALADAHAAFLDGEMAAAAQIAQVGAILDRAASLLRTLPPNGGDFASLRGSFATLGDPPVPDAGPDAATVAAVATLREDTGNSAPIRSIARDPRGPTETPRSFDYDALLAFADGKLSDCLGPAYADLDVYEPRTRLPNPPLLLVSRVLTVEGERGKLGRSRVVTEYDIPADAWWSHDGKAPPCVVVESGQADLFLVSYLGIEAICRGKRIYRLLDCDLTFHGPRPALGETLRHDIRIHRFARLGDTTLFYFEYDCVSATDGRPVLTMRQGCAGFFTPEELAKPQGVRPPQDVPSASPIPPLLPGAPSSLDDAACAALEEGRYSAAFGAAFAPADGSSLRLPRSPWRLVHRVEELRTSGGPHGLGVVRAVQDLRDDDWFNDCHFKGDPCMPGTLMFDGCTQALQLWLMAMGWTAEYPQATFEPIPGLAARLRCRGQVVPGQSRLEYEVRVKEAGVEPTPWAKADVILHVDGTAVVLAHDVGVRIEGERRPLPARGADPDVHTVDEARVIEFSVGDPSRAFGPVFAPYDHGARTARMPGPPYLTMTRVVAVDGPAGVIAADKSVSIAYDVPKDAWYFQASPGTSMPFAVLTEVALQPCGWITAWQHTAPQLGGDVYFRNLGGTMTVHRQVWPHTGTLVTTAKHTSVSRSGGMVIHSFAITMRQGDDLVLECTTQFGYFTGGALANQKGLQPPAAEEARRDAARAAGDGAVVDLRDAPVIPGVRPRGDLRMLDRITVLAPEAGRAGLGWWRAEKDVDPKTWYYTAHFHQDPVMPGSLGLEGLAQLAREAMLRRWPELAEGPWHVEPVATGATGTWKYRGQVPPERKQMVVEIEVLALASADDTREIVVDGYVYADGLAIYELRDLRVRAIRGPSPQPAAAVRERPPAKAALLDTFDVQGDEGHGVLRLDPDLHPWLADHCPTVVVPAVPMAFAAEIAAEAALLLRPGRKVVGLPAIEAQKWIHTGDGPVDLLVDAAAAGDEVKVSLSLFKVNERFPKLSGPVAHMRATVRLGDDWAPAEPEPGPLEAEPVAMTAREYYDGGLTFHGPVLQGMIDLGVRGPRGAEAIFRTRPDGDLVPGHAFVLDPLLLDVATHPMMSGALELWKPGLEGKLAYPVKAEGMRFFGPRPEGEVRCRLDLVHVDERTVAFDVRMSGANGPWCAFRWTEALVEGGPVLGQPSAVRRPFCWERTPDARVRIGCASGSGWAVAADDLVEPLPGTLARLYSTKAEMADWAVAKDRDAWAVDRIAAKEAVRSWLHARLGRDVHPATLQLVRLRPDLFVVTEAFTLTAQEYTDHLGPTRFDLRIRSGGGSAEAAVVPRTP